ncbi:MAG: hypothetical protein DI537_17470 [Stutzerimonas stutzeri]|nr:MAG: hypothetical protein DI537_17470 [Stutzerimonas stutzeri]
MLNQREKPSEAVVSGLGHAFETVWRWGDESDPSFVCIATNLGRGRVAVITDAGIQNPRGSDYGPFSDLYVSKSFRGGAAPDDLVPVKSVYECPVTPISLLTLDLPSIDALPAPRFASMASMETRRSPKVWRMGFADGVFPDQEMSHDRPARFAKGYPNRPVCRSTFRGSTDRLFSQHTSVVVECCLDYPGRCDFGAPVCDEDGDLAGVLVGNDTATGYTHIGYYVPVEILLPFIELESVLGSRRSGVFGIHERVTHTRA